MRGGGLSLGRLDRACRSNIFYIVPGWKRDLKLFITYTSFPRLTIVAYWHCLMRIQYKCMVTIYVSPEMTARHCYFQKQNYYVLSPDFHIHVPLSDLCILRIGLPILLQPNRQTDHGNL